MKLTLDNPPEGYAAEAEWRVPLDGEHFISEYEEVVIANDDGIYRFRIVLTPLAKPSEPKVVRYEVQADKLGYLMARDIPLLDWPTMENFAGFVFRLPSHAEIISSVPRLWLLDDGSVNEWISPAVADRATMLTPVAVLAQEGE